MKAKRKTHRVASSKMKGDLLLNPSDSQRPSKIRPSLALNIELTLRIKVRTADLRERRERASKSSQPSLTAFRSLPLSQRSSKSRHQAYPKMIQHLLKDNPAHTTQHSTSLPSFQENNLLSSPQTIQHKLTYFRPSPHPRPQPTPLPSQSSPPHSSQVVSNCSTSLEIEPSRILLW